MSKKRNKKLTEQEQEELDMYLEKEKKSDMNQINIKKITLTPKQLSLMDTIRKNKITVVTGPAGTSKAQPLTSKILTPTGWKLMGDIKVNDLVIGVNGKPTKVLGVFPQGIKEIFKVKFSDGSSTECTSDHLWLTWNVSERNYYKKKNNIKIKTEHSGTVRNTEEIKDTLFGSGGRLNHSIPIVKPIEFKTQNYYIEPYLMGALLGDGHLGRYIGFSTNDNELFEKINNILLVKEHKLKVRSKKGKFVECAIIRECNENSNDNILNLIRDNIGELGLLNTLSDTKFIPEIYLFGSIEQRVELLQGLLDTDGTVTRGCIKFTTVSSKLRDDMISLIRSLGGTVTYNISKPTYTYKGKKMQGKDAYFLNINLPEEIASRCFSLERKQKLVKPRVKYFPVRYITDISKVRDDLAQCIMVEDENHLYITDDYIVTHNTFSSCFTSLIELRKLNYKKIIITKPTEIVGGTNLGFLPGPLEEKISVYMQSFISIFSKMLTGEQLKEFMDEKIIEFVPAQFVRGDTFDDSIIIIDEFQSFDISTLMAIVTRLGKNSKMIFVGDAKQNDINKKYVAVDTFKHILDGVEDTDTFEFNREDIVRDKILIDIIDNYERLEAQNSLPQTQGNK